MFPIVAVCQEIPHRGRHKLRWQGWVLIGDRMSGGGVGNGNLLSSLLGLGIPVDRGVWRAIQSMGGSQRRRRRVKAGRRVQREPNSTLLSARSDGAFYRESERREWGSVVREVKH